MCSARISKTLIENTFSISFTRDREVGGIMSAAQREICDLKMISNIKVIYLWWVYHWKLISSNYEIGVAISNLLIFDFNHIAAHILLKLWFKCDLKSARTHNAPVIKAKSFVIIPKSLVCDLDVIRNQRKDWITSTLASHYHCNKTYLSL